MFGFTAIAASVTVVLPCAACGAARLRPVPKVAGQRLDVAEDRLDAAGFRYRTVGGGIFGIVVRSHWTVCRQRPQAPSLSMSVTLFVARSCPPVRSVATPDVVGAQLNYAEVVLKQAGLSLREVSVDGDPILVESLWIVCDQSPEPGKRARAVELDVAHDWTECDVYTSW